MFLLPEVVEKQMLCWVLNARVNEADDQGDSCDAWTSGAVTVSQKRNTELPKSLPSCGFSYLRYMALAIYFLINLFLCIYLAVPSRGCGMRTLSCSMWN